MYKNWKKILGLDAQNRKCQSKNSDGESFDILSRLLAVMVRNAQDVSFISFIGGDGSKCSRCGVRWKVHVIRGADALYRV